MQLALSEEETAFREEMRTFFTTKIPQEIRDTVAAGGHVGKDAIVQTQPILNEAGIADKPETAAPAPGGDGGMGGMDF